MTPWRIIPTPVAGAAWAWLGATSGRAAGATFRVDGRPTTAPHEFRLDRVDRSNDDRPWLVADAAAGWASARQVQHVAAASREIAIDPSAYHDARRALIWDAPGKADLALADNTEALRIEPDNRTGPMNRGPTSGRKHEPGRAIADYDAIVRLNPGSAGTFKNRGRARHAQGGYPRAAADAESARLAPDGPWPLAGRAGRGATRPGEHHRDGPRAIAAARAVGW